MSSSVGVWNVMSTGYIEPFATPTMATSNVVSIPTAFMCAREVTPHDVTRVSESVTQSVDQLIDARIDLIDVTTMGLKNK